MCTSAFIIVHFFLFSGVTTTGTVPFSCICVGLICVIELIPVIILFKYFL
jgi:hypothetical protein